MASPSMTFADAARFPTFQGCPIIPSTDGPAPSLTLESTGSTSQESVGNTVALQDPAKRTAEDKWWLLAQIKENMTIMKPTLVVTDRSGVDFALTMENKEFELKGFKKGFTVVVPNARRTAPEWEGKKGFVKLQVGEETGVKVLPARLERVTELGETMRSPERVGVCATCGHKDEQSGEKGTVLKKCMGCGVVQYCGKDCQTKGWKELDHKTECKVFQTMADIWPAGISLS